ncbi:uncharacterized protein METZ01_LOCUS386925 [marine metagenome]|uniref:Uncharacterized protein n=1 Tax=marine metagenome TaxID=408172 RepID=A0A382UK53_9ZZZZ
MAAYEFLVDLAAHPFKVERANLLRQLGVHNDL